MTALYTAEAGVHNADLGEWTWQMPAQSQLDSLYVAWSCTVAGVAYGWTDVVDVVGQRLVDPARLRQDSALQKLATPDLLFFLDLVEERIRDVIGYPPVLEGFRQSWDTLRGTLNDSLFVSGTVNGLPYGWGAGKMMIPGVKFPTQVYSGTINGIALDPVADIQQLCFQYGALVWADYRPWMSGRYSLWGTHGDTEPSADLAFAAMKLLKHLVTPSNIPDRAYSVQTEGASILISMPTADRPTGLPEVDAILNRYRLESVI